METNDTKQDKDNTQQAEGDSVQTVVSSQNNDLLGAAMRLLGRLRITHSTKAYRDVWECAQSHLGQYDGLTYTQQMDDLHAEIEKELLERI